MRPARALPYEFFVRVHGEGIAASACRCVSSTRAAPARCFSSTRRTSLDAPRTYTVEAGKRLQDQLPLNADGTYDFTVYGPNGFLRRFAGKPVRAALVEGSDSARPEVAEGYDVANGNLQLRLKNLGTARCEFKIVNAYDPNNVIRRTVRGGDTDQICTSICATRTAGTTWPVTVNTDPPFARRLAGHVETGKSSMSDPALGS